MSLVAFASPRVVTCDAARATANDPLGVVEDGVVVVNDGAIVAVGPRDRELARFPDARLVDDPRHGVISPGLVDAHTHAAWVGSRHDEWAARLAGDDYEAIAARGGGIVRSCEDVERADVGEIERVLVARLARMRAMGVTTVEVKSGYGLDRANEAKLLRAIARAANRAGMPRVVPTFLALHALPPERRNDRAAYVREQAAFVAEVAESGLARFVDVYVDRGAFTLDEGRLVGEAAREAGLGMRVHAGQMADVGAARLAAELGAASADHLEHVAPADLEALVRAGTRAVLLPVASFTLGQAPPDVAAMRRAGVALVVASDANPGTAPTESLPLALSLGARLYGLSPAETLLGATREAAASLGLGEVTGRIASGLKADLVAWDLPHETAIAQPWGVPLGRVLET